VHTVILPHKQKIENVKLMYKNMQNPYAKNAYSPMEFCAYTAHNQFTVTDMLHVKVVTCTLAEADAQIIKPVLAVIALHHWHSLCSPSLARWRLYHVIHGAHIQRTFLYTPGLERPTNIRKRTLCALGPLKASELGGKTPAPNGKVGLLLAHDSRHQ